MNNFYLIGLVGNLGSGKSTVRKMLEELGARGIDGDALAHVVMQRGSSTWRAVVGAFGLGILQFNGRIDRRKLGAKIFADPAALAKLESISHPAVRKATLDVLRANTKPIVVIEAVKLVQAGMHLNCDALWAVDCAPDVAVERVMRTRNMREQDARARLTAQGSFEPQKKLAHVVIDNSGDLNATRVQVHQAFALINPESARDKSEWLFGLPRVVAPPVIETSPAPVIETSPIVVALEPTQVLPEPVVEPTPIIVEPEPAPVAPPIKIETPPQPVEPKSIEVRRSRRNDLDALAIAIAKKENRDAPLTREETLKRFGERGYRIAVSGKQIVALVAWEAENLVALVREIWADSAEDATVSLSRLFDLVENEARDLLCETAILMIEYSAPDFITAELKTSGYAPTELNVLHPVWRQVVQDRLQPGEQIWGKQLREQIATKPF